MSEYWKSTPSYWCKFCKTYVRDTNLERKNHESTPKHQGNIQRSLRDLHKTQERETREKARAEDVVARLTGEKGAAGSGPQTQTQTQTQRPPQQQPQLQQKATPQYRQRQAEQLAAMGVELPAELRKAVTGVGGWSTVSQRVVHYEPGVKNEKGEEEERKEIVTDANGMVLSRGVRKRKVDDEEDGEGGFGEELAPKRKVWGSSIKKYKAGQDSDGGDGDLDALLSGIKKKQPNIKTEDVAETEDAAKQHDVTVKKEELPEDETTLAAVPDVAVKTETDIKHEPDPDVPVVVFKKRKGAKKA